MNYAVMKPCDTLTVAYPSGEHKGKYKPSSEWRFHGAIYAARPDVGAIVHVHSPAAVAMACMNTEIPAFTYMIAIANTDTVKVAPYALFGTEELSKIVVSTLGSANAVLLANHGLIAVGATMDKAMAVAVRCHICVFSSSG